MRYDYFVFLCFMKAVKISGLKEWAELVANQLTQVYLHMQFKIKCLRKSVVENSVYLD